MAFISAGTVRIPIYAIVITGIVVIIAVATIAMYWPRTDALSASLQPLLNEQKGDQFQIASAILKNYEETRSNAARWSGVYWGFTFLAAIFSALAGFILKVESVFKNNQERKKDIAAFLSVAAALLITISTGGDFQRKWQANRIAASELEQIGYKFLENKTAEPLNYYSTIGDILHKRNLAIVGNVDKAQSNSGRNTP